ncbi:hypothetical protein GOP47_0010222 [Adiantum capillus-veneris]|uniref:GDSL esterase/lipase n=1 Tax=Adiantum capillus-veneris TaxID=13818 RepID=A0A9D4ZIK0_ADICA|nr:hypothetical protein GOP47_0010222 [Adiantum capillus-veneris]
MQIAGTLISLCAFLFLAFINAAESAQIMGAYPALFIFGDSLSDTGNAALEALPYAMKTTHLPYGETFPGWPSGRFSDGHLLVDLLATHFDLPLPNPFLNASADFVGGVNFAVAGSTALNPSCLTSLKVKSLTNLSLDVQISWHLKFKAEVESSIGLLKGSPTEAAFAEALYVIESGGNDYVYAYSAGYTPSFINFTLIPLVVQKIQSAVNTLISNGARNFLFVTITPLGCLPALLSRYNGTKDSIGCLEEYNQASFLHGAHLQTMVETLRISYPNDTFLLMDFYGAYKYVQNHNEEFGFVKSLEACCGAGDDYPYNYNADDECNENSASLCSDPTAYISWDGVHFTDAFHVQIFNQTFITGSFLDGAHKALS